MDCIRSAVRKKKTLESQGSSLVMRVEGLEPPRLPARS